MRKITLLWGMCLKLLIKPVRIGAIPDMLPGTEEYLTTPDWTGSPSLHVRARPPMEDGIAGLLPERFKPGIQEAPLIIGPF